MHRKKHQEDREEFQRRFGPVREGFVLLSLDMTFYAEWYREDVSPNLSKEQKEKLLMKISELSLEVPIHQPGIKIPKHQFPELILFMHTEQLSGRQLYAVYCELFEELRPEQSKRLGKPYITFPRR